MAVARNSGITALRGRGRRRTNRIASLKAPASGGGVNLGTQGMPGPGGAQLARRVASGAISQEQAQKTMQQRQTLRKAYGADWRTKAYGDLGYVRRTRQALAKNPSNPQLIALNKQLMQRRKYLLDKAMNG